MDPKNVDKRGNVADDWVKVSDLRLALGDGAAALEGYQKSLAIWESLVQANPEDPDELSQLALTHEKIGACYTRQAARGTGLADWRLARASYQKSLGIWGGLEQKKKLDKEYQGKPAEIAQLVEKCARAIARSSASTSAENESPVQP